MTAFFPEGGQQLMLVILFKGVNNCRTLDSLFPRIDFLVQYPSFRDQQELELQRAWSLLGAQGFNNDDDDENNNNNNNNNNN